MIDTKIKRGEAQIESPQVRPHPGDDGRRDVDWPVCQGGVIGAPVDPSGGRLGLYRHPEWMMRTGKEPAGMPR
jgi:hypothetical protein